MAILNRFSARFYFIAIRPNFLLLAAEFQERKTAQRESFRDRYPADVPGSFVQKISGRPSKPWKNEHLGADIHDPNPRTSMTPAGAKHFGQKNFNFGLTLRSPKVGPQCSIPQHYLCF